MRPIAWLVALGLTAPLMQAADGDAPAVTPVPAPAADADDTAPAPAPAAPKPKAVAPTPKADAGEDEDAPKPKAAPAPISAAPVRPPAAARPKAGADDDEDDEPKHPAAAKAPGAAAGAGDVTPASARGPVFEDVSKVTGDYIDPDLIPDAPNPLTLFGDGFWEPGRVASGRITPTLIIYGDVRTAYAAFGKPDSGHDSDVATLRTKPTLEADLALTATERVHARFEPLTHNGVSTGMDFEPKSEFDYQHSLKPSTLFFEGELDSIVSDFGGAAQHDEHDLNYALAVGKFPLELHNGYLISDIFTGVGITKNNIQVPWASDFGIGVVYAFHDVDVAALPTADDGDFQLVTLHSFADLTYARAEASLNWLGVRRSDAVPGGNDRQQFFAGLSLNWLRAPVGEGLHLFGQLGNESTTGNAALVVYESNYTLSPMHVDGGTYLLFNAFYGTRRWTSISGNLNQVGTTFQGDGLTGFPHLQNNGNDSAGGAISLEIKTLRRRLHFIPEVAWVDDLSDANNDVRAIGLRINYGFGRRHVVRVDLRRFFPTTGEAFNAGRAEYQIKF